MDNNSEDKEIVGYIEQDGIKITFVGRNYRFIFVPEKDADINNSQINGLYIGNNNKTLKTDHGFIKGTTVSGESILIYAQNDLELKPYRCLNTWLYIVSENRFILDTYDVIRFDSGVLKSLFLSNSLRINYNTSDDNKIYTEYKEDTITVDIPYENIGDNKSNSLVVANRITVSSNVKSGISINEGSYIKNDGVLLKLFMKNSSKIVESFIDNYKNVFTMCQFMYYRKNISFDKIELMKKDSKGSLRTVAQCHIKRELEIDNSRPALTYITFNELRDNAAKLYQIIQSRDKKNSRYLVDFIPKSDRDVAIVDPEKIKQICTSLEFEENLLEIKGQESQNLQKIITEIKKQINDTKSTENKLTDREYSYIYGSLNNWSAPAFERAYMLYQRHQDEIKPLLSNLQINDISENDIQELIKIRNSMTHGSFYILTDRLATVAAVMAGTVYASVLTRCGCSSERIKNWFSRRILY